jgi:predicted permease
MRSLAVVLALPVLLFAGFARADEPDTSLAVLAGGATSLAGFIVGGAVLATGHRQTATNNAGWLSIEGGFVLAPLVAHGAVGEWGRGAAFSAVPAAALAGTAVLFDAVPGVVDEGTLPQQRLMWSLFVTGLLASAVGVVDPALAGRRMHRVAVVPSVSRNEVGIQIGGVL